MIALLMITVMITEQLWASPTQDARNSSASPAAPASERRLFEVRSQQAWELVQKRLNELGFSLDKIDRQNQLVLTKWREVGARGMEWLPKPARPGPYVAERIRFEVFVSPFAE